MNLFGFVEDITEEVLNGRQDKVALLINNIEGKTLDEISTQDIVQMLGYLKVLHSKVDKLDNQSKDILKRMNMYYQANQELAGMAKDLSASVVGKKEESDRVVSIVNQYTTDTRIGFLKFELDGESVQITRNKLRQIISWYRKGYVFFEMHDNFSIVGIQGKHKYSFGEIVSFKDRDDENTVKDAIVTGETPWSVDVLFLSNFDISENYITPNHVVKSRITKKSETSAIIDKPKLMSFMRESNYVNFFHNETVMDN